MPSMNLMKQDSAPLTPGRVLTIERRKNVSLAEFRRIYLKPGVPVVLQGAARAWPCVQKWTPDYLSEHFGHMPVTLIDAAPQNMSNINYQPEQATLKDVIEQMESAPLKMYSRFNQLLYHFPELVLDFDKSWLLKHRNRVASGQTFQVFIGGNTSKTHLHAASEHNLFTQVYGRKHWILYPPAYDCVLRPPVNRTPYFHSAFDPDHPDFETYPEMQYLDRYECTLEPGDILFNPPSWWHHVTNLSGSIGVGFRWFSPQDAFRLDASQALLTLLATNPPIWTATKYRADFAKIFSLMKRS